MKKTPVKGIVITEVSCIEQASQHLGDKVTEMCWDAEKGSKSI